MVGLAFSGSEVDPMIKIVQFLVDGFWVSVVLKGFGSQLFDMVV